MILELLWNRPTIVPFRLLVMRSSRSVMGRWPNMEFVVSNCYHSELLTQSGKEAAKPATQLVAEKSSSARTTGYYETEVYFHRSKCGGVLIGSVEESAQEEKLAGKPRSSLRSKLRGAAQWLSKKLKRKIFYVRHEWVWFWVRVIVVYPYGYRLLFLD